MIQDEGQSPSDEEPDIPEPGPVFDLSDTSTLLATLLVYVARGDGEISSQETQRMVDLLVRNNGIRTAQAMERLSAAVMCLADGEAILEDVRQAASGSSTDDKQGMFACMLEVAAADNVRNAQEIGALNKAAELLELSEQDKHTVFQAFFASTD